MTDQQRRWSSGDCPRVEDFIAATPELENDRQGLLELIFAEVSLRQARGETPSLDEYRARFPSHADTLERGWNLMLHRPRSDAEANTEVDRRSLLHAPKLPGYELLAELGRGGMGVAYRAKQLGLGREVCVKLVFADLKDEEGLTRFAVEARAVGRLDHPNVVRVFESGVCDGVPFLVMELVPGGSLAALVKAAALAPRRAAEVVRDAAHGVQAVHDAGVVHRDIKPANILMAADGSPKVADFGLAKLADDAGDLTGTDRAMGTPHYMAPEQAEGKTRDAGPEADVWSLGATLYACLTGKSPFRGKATADILARVKAANPVPPRSVDAGVPRDLEAICLKCLEKDPKRRYGTAAELRDDLQRWLDGHPVTARRAGAVRRAISWTRRNPRRAFLASAVAAVPAIAFGGYLAWGVDWVDEELKKGKGAELFDRESRPRRSRWAAGEHSGHRVAADDGAFAAQAESTALLELAATPRLDRFRFECQIRHERGLPATSIGLYVGHRPQRVSGRTVHVYLAVTINDVVSELAQFKALQKIQPAMAGMDPPRGNPVYVRLCAYPAIGWKEDGVIYGSGPAEPVIARPHGAQNGPWRTLAVEVRPGSVRMFWGPDGEEPQGGASVVPTAKLVQTLTDVCGKLPADDAVFGLTPVFDPRGGIGLVVQRGVASFRRPAITPL